VSTRYVALLRGINVGGANLIPMAALRASFESCALADVSTYIQSGNVIFSASGTEGQIAARIGKVLAAEFGYTGLVLLRSQAQMRDVIAKAPGGFGKRPDKYRYDVAFLDASLVASAAVETIRRREGVDEAAVGPGVIYFSRLISRASQSYLPKLASMPIYQQMTVRNWNTTTKLLALMDAGFGVGLRPGRRKSGS
jgi:uncharacterized protein (DUF1697 family)